MSRRSRPWRLAAAVLATAWSAAAGGCAADPTLGYSTAPPFSADIATIAVPVMGNDSFVRDVEFELTDALIKEIEARTPYRVTEQSRADSILTGHVRKVELDQLSKSRLTGLGEEVILGVTIDFEWLDLRTDAPLLERRSFSGHGLFVPSAPTRERVELGRMAVVQQLARDIVDDMRSAW